MSVSTSIPTEASTGWLTAALSLAADNPLLLAPLPLLALIFVIGAIREPIIKARILSGRYPNERMKTYRHIMLELWALAIICIAAWFAGGFSLAELGFNAQGGWRYWAGWAIAGGAIAYLAWSLFQTARSREARDSVRKQVAASGDLVLIRPETPREHRRFQWVSLTAGITEEIIFRGYLIGVLALVLPVWVAAILATLVFIIGHSYQGVAGMMRITPISAVLAFTFVLSGSLWPCIVLHIAVDSLSGGILAQLDRHARSDAEAAAAAG